MFNTFYYDRSGDLVHDGHLRDRPKLGILSKIIYHHHLKSIGSTSNSQQGKDFLLFASKRTTQQTTGACLATIERILSQVKGYG